MDVTLEPQTEMVYWPYSHWCNGTQDCMNAAHAICLYI